VSAVCRWPKRRYAAHTCISIPHALKLAILRYFITGGKTGIRNWNYVNTYKDKAKNVTASNMWTQGRNFDVRKYINIADITVCTIGNAIFALGSLLIPYLTSSQSAASCNYLTWKRLMNISCKEVSMFYCYGGGQI